PGDRGHEGREERGVPAGVIHDAARGSPGAAQPLHLAAPQGTGARRGGRLRRRLGVPAGHDLQDVVARQAGSVALLATAGLTRSFGSLVAVDGVDFALEPGEVRAVIGPNGAGKTVFMHLLSGLLAPTRGTIALDGADVTRLDVVERVRRGVTRSF